MGLILDTCILIHTEKRSKAVDFDQWQSYGETFLCVVTVSELLIGVHHADTEAGRLKRSAFVEMMIQAIPVIDFTRDVARIHAELYSSLAKKGHLIGAHDLIIAATALAHGHALLTTNQKEFCRVPGLKVISP
jgi:predicted nucleic acid-binding protein